MTTINVFMTSYGNFWVLAKMTCRFQSVPKFSDSEAKNIGLFWKDGSNVTADEGAARASFAI